MKLLGQAIWKIYPELEKVVKVIWQRLHWMTPRTRHMAYTALAATDLSHVTDGQTDIVNIGKNSLHVMHSMQPKIRKCS